MKTPFAAKVRRRLPEILLLLVSGAFAFGLVEGAVRLLDLWTAERAFTAAQDDAMTGVAADSDSDSDADAGSDDVDEGDAISGFVLHPFRGWAAFPASREGEEIPAAARLSSPGPESWRRLNNKRNAEGFASAIGDYRNLDPDAFVVGILGGSVALHVGVFTGDALARRLEERRPELAGKVYIVNLAFGGYKQPQQLNLLEEVLLLGRPLDVAVNLDGFNEVALGNDNASAGHHPLFPHRKLLSQAYDVNAGGLSPAQIEAAAEIFALNREARELRRSVAPGTFLGRSELARAAVGWRLTRVAARRVELEETELRSEGEATRSTLYDLSDPCLGRRFRCWELIGDIWARSSLAMSAVAKRFGVLYVHALQPNQHLEGSKPLSDEERACCYNPGGGWGQSVQRAYPVLKKRVDRLKRLGVDFHDLSTIFAEHPETLYRDPCCHLLDAGNRMLAEALADRIADAIEREGQRGRRRGKRGKSGES